MCLKQELAGYSLGAESSLLLVFVFVFVFVSEILLRDSHAHSFMSKDDCFCSTTAELNGCNRDHMACEPKIFII